MVSLHQGSGEGEDDEAQSAWRGKVIDKQARLKNREDTFRDLPRGGGGKALEGENRIALSLIAPTVLIGGARRLNAETPEIKPIRAVTGYAKV